MAVNLDKPQLWKQDTQASVDHYNKWFMKFAPRAFRDTRIQVTKSVEQAILDSNDMRDLSPDLLLSRPGILPTLRMSCCPPLAVDRLVGLAYTSKNSVGRIEGGKPPTRMNAANRDAELSRICRVISTMLDRDIFPWLDGAKGPTDHERHRASTIVADRLCSAVAKDTVRSAAKTYQLSLLARTSIREAIARSSPPVARTTQRTNPQRTRSSCPFRPPWEGMLCSPLTPSFSPSSRASMVCRCSSRPNRRAASRSPAVQIIAPWRGVRAADDLRPGCTLCAHAQWLLWRRLSWDASRRRDRLGVAAPNHGPSGVRSLTAPLDTDLDAPVR